MTGLMRSSHLQLLCADTFISGRSDKVAMQVVAYIGILKYKQFYVLNIVKNNTETIHT